MAERRMLAKTIIDSDAFLDMPFAAQMLYVHLNMRADDDGFINNPRRTQRMIGASESDLELLIEKSFIIAFDSGVVVIKHWLINNYIRGDRKRDTAYEEEMALLSVKENGAYTLNKSQVAPQKEETEAPRQPSAYQVPTKCLPSDNQLPTNCLPTASIGKDRIGEDRIGKDRIGEGKVDCQQIVDMYNDTCVSFPKVVSLSETRKKAIKARIKSGYRPIDFQTAFEMAEESHFLKGGNDRNWSATFDWMIKDSNLAKILEGNYANRSRATNSAAKELDDFANMMEEWRNDKR